MLLGNVLRDKKRGKMSTLLTSVILLFTEWIPGSRSFFVPTLNLGLSDQGLR